MGKGPADSGAEMRNRPLASSAATAAFSVYLHPIHTNCLINVTMSPQRSCQSVPPHRCSNLLLQPQQRRRRRLWERHRPV